MYSMVWCSASSRTKLKLQELTTTVKTTDLDKINCKISQNDWQIMNIKYVKVNLEIDWVQNLQAQN